MKNVVTIQNNEILKEDASDYYTIVETDKKLYAIKTSEVLEILKIMELDKPNSLPSCILGIIQYNQTPVGVIDLRSILNTERIIYDISAKIITLKTNEKLCSIVCDKVLDIRKLDKQYIHSVPYQNNTNFFDGLYVNHEENIYILNIENILNFAELRSRQTNYNRKEENYVANDEDSKKILAERKSLINKIKDEVQTTIPLYNRGVSFLINDVKYYINMASVREFYKVNNSKFIKVPNTPDYIFGIINIKGDFITVLDIRRLFNTSATTIKEKSTIIILNSNEYKAGILADEICESMDVDFDAIIQNRLNNQDENKMMEFVNNGEIYQVLDVETLLRDERLTIC